MKKTLLTAFLWMGALCLAARVEAAPKILFEPMVYDFGKTSQVAVVSGVFKFKNIGDSILKVESLKPACGCTIAEVEPDTLQPGESGELTFTFHLGQVRAQLEKHIGVTSNDLQSPETVLTIKADYTPLYEMNPMTLAPNLAFGVNDSEQFAVLTRTDGKPIKIIRLDPSKPWITAAVEPAVTTSDAAARIRVIVHREGVPRRFNEFVHIYADDQSNSPASSLGLYGQIMGEVALTPEALYWNVPAAANAPTAPSDELILRRLTISSADGRALSLKNPQSTIKGLKVSLVPKDEGKVYELLARLDELPVRTVSGTVTFETSRAAQSRIEVPVIVNVSDP